LLWDCRRLAGLGLVDLVDARPDFVVGDAKGHYVIDKGLCFPGALGNAKCLRQQLLDEFEMRGGFKGCVKGQDWSRALEAVSGKMQLFHCVQVLQMEFDGGTVGGLAHPDVKIFAFAGFEEEDVVAVVEVGEFVELVEFGLCV
jgi:hypothetical protein